MFLAYKLMMRGGGNYEKESVIVTCYGISVMLFCFNTYCSLSIRWSKATSGTDRRTGRRCGQNCAVSSRVSGSG